MSIEDGITEQINGRTDEGAGGNAVDTLLLMHCIRNAVLMLGPATPKAREEMAQAIQRTAHAEALRDSVRAAKQKLCRRGAAIGESVIVNVPRPGTDEESVQSTIPVVLSRDAVQSAAESVRPHVLGLLEWGTEQLRARGRHVDHIILAGTGLELEGLQNALRDSAAASADTLGHSPIIHDELPFGDVIARGCSQFASSRNWLQNLRLGSGAACSSRAEALPAFAPPPNLLPVRNMDALREVAVVH